MFNIINDAVNSAKEFIGSEIEKIPKRLGIDSSEKRPEPLAERPKQVSTAYTLVLAIRATKIDILNDLQKVDYVSAENADKLYQLAKFLWLGSKQEFTSNFSDLFFPRYLGIDTGEESEYDIYLLRIQIREYDQGFAKNAKSNRRFDAFQRLSEIGKLADISGRLPAIACENKGFYQC